MAAYSSCVLLTLLSVMSTAGTVDECPPWFTQSNNNTQCVCRETMDMFIICDQMNEQSFLRLGFCAFYNSTTHQTVVAACPYVFPDHLIKNHLIPLPKNSSKLNHFICGSLNRDTGTPLCGRCTNSTGPSIYSAGSQCVSCSAVNIVYYLLLQYLPTTILFLVIILFRISISSALMVHYVLFCSGIAIVLKSSAGMYANFHFATNYKIGVVNIGGLFFTLNSIWTLDFFYFLSPPLCVSVHMEEMYIPFLDTVATLYPFVLLLLTYVGIELHAHGCKFVVCLWRPIHRTYVRFRRTWDPNASVVQAFATLFFLSYTKFIALMYEALFISLVINEDGKMVSSFLYTDPTVATSNRKHWYLYSLSLFILFFIVLPPIAILITFPTCVFKKVSRFLKPKWIVSMQIFVDVFQGCYKDGTSGTRDYRAVSGYILAIWAFLPAVMITTTAQQYRTELLPYITFIILFTALAFICAVLQPYKCRTANISGVALNALYVSAVALLILGRINFQNSTVLVVLNNLLLSLPHCVFYGYIVCKLRKWFKQCCCKTREMEDSVEEQRSLLRSVETP